MKYSSSCLVDQTKGRDGPEQGKMGGKSSAVQRSWEERNDAVRRTQAKTANRGWGFGKVIKRTGCFCGSARTERFTSSPLDQPIGMGMGGRESVKGSPGGKEGEREEKESLSNWAELHAKRTGATISNDTKKDSFRKESGGGSKGFP